MWVGAAEDAKSPSDSEAFQKTYGRQDRGDRAQRWAETRRPTPASWCVDDPTRPNRATHDCGTGRRPGTRQSNGACLGRPDWRARAIGGRANCHQIGYWAIQFAEPKSEVEAKVAAARLNAKYAPALNGATIGVRRTQVNGETIYALRVAGLSKADAMVLCVRVKGRDCSIIK